ncbi:hypothetical protein Ancab_019676 [Ancistrocladus abbreviatus]
MRLVDVKAVKSELDLGGCKILQQHEHHEAQLAHLGGQESENTSSNAFSTTGQSGISMLDQSQSPIDDKSLSSTSPLCPAPLCRQFWKAGDYDDALASKTRIQNNKSHMHVHPKFLHSNATSHKWAFGAVAELLDNSIDEIQNGATFVIVDKISDPRDDSPALLIQDDGGGMDPDAMRCCMSFGFSDKKSKSAIGQYGNGFKTGTMRLGADVIVFSKHMADRTLTQSIGLLSYTYLTKTGSDRIVVPMVDYETDMSTGKLQPLLRYGREHFSSNLSILLQWSPFSTLKELLKQFDDIESHGTKVIIYNLWFSDDGSLEFDFETDPEDIRLCHFNKSETLNARMSISEEHIGNQFRYSLRVYLSILYLRVPQNFTIILRGKIVQHHNLANDLKFVEFILYKPQTGGTVEGQVITTIGFLKEAPRVNIHGFNVYHKNRLILPFWQVVSYTDSRGRGVVGVLEANFVEPTHNKQDFEKTSLFQKLENRLKEMTWEYWDYHCGLIGYQVKKKIRAPIAQHNSTCDGSKNVKHEPIKLSKNSSPVGVKRPLHYSSQEPDRVHEKTRVVLDINEDGSNKAFQPATSDVNQLNGREATVLMEENNKLHAKCSEHAKMEETLHQQVSLLRRELEEAQCEYARMLAELESLDAIKKEESVV